MSEIIYLEAKITIGRGVKQRFCGCSNPRPLIFFMIYLHNYHIFYLYNGRIIYVAHVS
jgi:hypothetical protein